jgi:hypothetical protein
MIFTFLRRYWNSINENGHIIESSSTATIQRLHELELLKSPPRIVWQGTAFKDWVIFVRNNHPMFSMFFADSIHPYSRHATRCLLLFCCLTSLVFRFERLCVWIACFGYSFLMASYTVELTQPTDCDKYTGYSAKELQEKFDCLLSNNSLGYFGFTFGAISAASFALNMILESLAVCKCAISITNEVIFYPHLLSAFLFHICAVSSTALPF